MLSCQRCKQSTNGPQAFLLTCRSCSKTWHHRCHMPPVEDAELFQRLRATNDQDMANGIYAWECRRCKKSGTPCATSSGGLTVSPAPRDDKKSVIPGDNSPAVKDAIPASVANVTRLARLGVKVESNTVVDALLNDREINDGKESADEALVERTLMDTNKRETMAARKLPHVRAQPSPTKSSDMEVDVLNPQEKKKPCQDSGARMVASADIAQDIPKIISRRVSGARKVIGTVTVQDLPKKISHQISGARKVAAPRKHPEDDVEMTDDAMITISSKSTPGPTLQAPQSSSLDSQLIGLKSTPEVQPDTRVASSISTRAQEGRPVDAVAIIQHNQDVDDDPEDLYGPPVERRVVRILPSLTEELRERQRRTALQKEERPKRADLAPDWIYAKYANDPSWKEVPTANERQTRRPRKGQARKLGGSGLNVNELVGYFTVADWVREHKVDKT